LNKGNDAKKEKVDWAGFTDSYFLTALLAPKDAPMDVHAYYSGDSAALNDKNSDKEYSVDMTFRPNAELAAKSQLANIQLFFGPKEKELLQKTRPALALAIDYGWFAPIAIPMMYILKFIDKLVKNYGWSIIIFTIILRMAMFPLTRKGQQSMKELQKLQPEMEKIRKKYPDDRMKQQEEIYALQRKYKINPMGGCLPMLVQIPVFFAFYKVLVVSIELRQAPWMLWIPDLSTRDPLLILPLLMGISQFVMQKLTPTAGVDPAQARMMQFMPLVFTVMLIYFPAGLLLYWTVSNIIGIAQQIYVMQVDKAVNLSPGQPT
jgi:YidC/Oxa1 family membrane protein insertase